MHVGDKKPPESGGNHQHTHSLNAVGFAAHLVVSLNGQSMMSLCVFNLTFKPFNLIKVGVWV